jgi:hypothetical protein
MYRDFDIEVRAEDTPKILSILAGGLNASGIDAAPKTQSPRRD